MKTNLEWRHHDGSKATTHKTIPHAFMSLSAASPNRATDWIDTLAMVDTGCTKTLLSPRIISALGLQPSGTVDLNGNAGTFATNTFRVLLRIPIKHRVEIGVECGQLDHALGFPEAEAVLGMDFLSYGVLLMQGPDRDSFFSFLPHRLNIYPNDKS